MTIVAEDEVLAAAELDLTSDDLAVDAAQDAHAGPAAEKTGNRQPFLVVEKGAPTDAEIAALVCVFAAAAAAPTESTDDKPRDLWGQPTMLHRTTAPFSPYAHPNLRF